MLHFLGHYPTDKENTEIMNMYSALLKIGCQGGREGGREGGNNDLRAIPAVHKCFLLPYHAEHVT